VHFAFRETWSRAPKFLADGYTRDCFDDQDFAPRVFQVNDRGQVPERWATGISFTSWSLLNRAWTTGRHRRSRLSGNLQGIDRASLNKTGDTLVYRVEQVASVLAKPDPW